MYNTSDLDMLQDALILQGIPDITNGNNCRLIYNKQFNFGFFVDPKDALYLCNYQAKPANYIDIKKELKSNKLNYISVIPEQAQIKYANIWNQKQNTDIKVLNKISNTFYSSPYKGTIVDGDQINYQFQRFEQITGIKGKSIFEKQLNENVIKNEVDYLNQVYNIKSKTFHCEYTKEEIPLNNLTQENTIKWASHITLFEDELGDNGFSNCEYRSEQWVIAFWIDSKILDTRIYHQFNWDYVLRDFTHREDSWRINHFLYKIQFQFCCMLMIRYISMLRDNQDVNIYIKLINILNKMSEVNNVFWQPFKTTKEFIEKDQKITKGLMQGAIFAVIGYGVGLVFFRARTLRGFTAGTAATWRFRDQIE